MGIPTTLRGISATAGSNSPAGTDVIGSTADDYLRSIQAVIRQYLASVASNIVSATTTDLSTADGFWVTITGTTTITSLGTEQAGIWYGLTFNGALTLTHNGTSLILPGAANITTAAGDTCFAYSLGSGNWRIFSYQKASGSSPVPVRSYLSGLTLSTAGSSATMTVAAGQATDSTNSVTMTLSSSTGKTTSAWAVGTGNGGLDTGAIANGTWYHFYEIMRPDTGVVDVLFSLSASAPTMPTNYSFKRRIGSGLTNGSAQWVSFTQDGDYFRWAASVRDVNTTAPGTSAVTATLASVPSGVNVLAMFNATYDSGASNVTSLLMYLSDLAANDEAPVVAAVPDFTFGFAYGSTATEIIIGGTTQVRTNTSQQIRYRVNFSAASTQFTIVTLGWIDRRGRDS